MPTKPTKPKPTKPNSIQELLACQVYELVRVTADFVCPEGKSVIEIEAGLLDHLAQDCALKRDVAKQILQAERT